MRAKPQIISAGLMVMTCLKLNFNFLRTGRREPSACRFAPTTTDACATQSGLYSRSGGCAADRGAWADGFQHQNDGRYGRQDSIAAAWGNGCV